MRVAVIGAGAGGLVTARELLRVGLTPVVLEAGEEVGGTWVYDERPGQHGAMYASLRTNLPADVMGFTDVPFEATRTFPSHAEVLGYLQRFWADSGLDVRFGRRVGLVARDGDGFAVDDERYDAVAVCTGHYHQPHVPELVGRDRFTGRVTHSHDYRRPGPFAGRRVAVLGAKSSGVDISGELARHASAVWLCSREHPDAPSRPGIETRASLVAADGSDLVLADGTRLRDVDDLLLCTGYDYGFPFLEPGLVDVEPKWVHPLWLDLICIRAPHLAFIGLPFQVVPFPLMELQARLFANMLVGRFELPDPAQMLAEHQRSVDALLAQGVPRRHIFKYGERQFDYLDDLARRLGSPAMPTSFRARYASTAAARRADPDGYRDG